MRYSMTVNWKVIRYIIGKNMVSTGKNWILNTLEFCAHCRAFSIREVLNIYINYHLIFYLGRQHVKWKHFKVTFSNDLWWTESSILTWPEMTLDMYLGDLIFKSELLRSGGRDEFYLI